MTTTNRRVVGPIITGIAIALAMAPAQAATMGMLDDFQSANVSGWGGGTAVAAIAGAGPAGAGDYALRISAAASARVAIVNTAQWTGDFRNAGVNRITLDVRNESAIALQLRVGLARGAVGPGGAGDTYVSASAISVPSDNTWRRVALSLNAEAFVPHVANSNPTPDTAAALAAISHFRILHNASPNFLGGLGPGTFYFDNIRAVPEPAASIYGAIGLGMAPFLLRLRRCHV